MESTSCRLRRPRAPPSSLVVPAVYGIQCILYFNELFVVYNVQYNILYIAYPVWASNLRGSFIA